MKMRNIIFSFFILAIFSNVKAATFQDANDNNPQSIAYASVAQPIVTFEHDEQNHTEYLDIINNIFHDKSENIKYAYQCNDHHWVITDFDISIDNSSRNLKRKLSEKGKEGLINGSTYFIAYIKDIIKYLISQHMHKYDFENYYHEDLKILSKDLKVLIYDEFDQVLKNDLIKYETGSENEKYHQMAKEFLEVLVNNSSMRIKGCFIKIRKDGNYMDLNKNDNLYFDIYIDKIYAKFDYIFKSLKPEVAELLTNLTTNA
ncbi:fam-d protein [Plasmodium chabaudi chabaudi]|uniref:Fam-d protein n=1 Tax=Plasmodium chabaudi chabaudi TaxID=31271 RepID=A0A4V0K7F9_PLACU|nr:fam-d protein [Plasmodium chabaudi chabaudi]VTZ68862.1 fam-d protein [Plasmodium chabaudi chabaudi]|eukprot:XP_743365.2 fam-d protein [Plasmodium chabaudi chabaudi]